MNRDFIKSVSTLKPQGLSFGGASGFGGGLDIPSSFGGASSQNSGFGQVASGLLNGLLGGSNQGGIPSGGGFGGGSSGGGFGQAAAGVLGNVLNSGGQGGKGGITAAGVTTAVGSAFGPIGTAAGAIVGKVLTELNFDENFNRMKKYGLSSWGASTDPSKELSDLQNHVLPIIEEQMSVMTDQNVGQVLTWLDGFIMFTHTGFKHLRENHARAGSTKAAYDSAMKKSLELREKFIGELVSSLKKAGVTINKKSTTVDFNSLEDRYTWHTGGKFDANHKYNVTYNNYTVTLPNVKTTPKNNGQNSNQSLNSQLNKEEAGSGGIISVIGIIALAYKILKG